MTDEKEKTTQPPAEGEGAPQPPKTEAAAAPSTKPKEQEGVGGKPAEETTPEFEGILDEILPLITDKTARALLENAKASASQQKEEAEPEPTTQASSPPFSLGLTNEELEMLENTLPGGKKIVEKLQELSELAGVIPRIQEQFEELAVQRLADKYQGDFERQISSLEEKGVTKQELELLGMTALTLFQSGKRDVNLVELYEKYIKPIKEQGLSKKEEEKQIVEGLQRAQSAPTTETAGTSSTSTSPPSTYAEYFKRLKEKGIDLGEGLPIHNLTEE